MPFVAPHFEHLYRAIDGIVVPERPGSLWGIPDATIGQRLLRGAVPDAQGGPAVRCPGDVRTLRLLEQRRRGSGSAATGHRSTAAGEHALARQLDAGQSAE